MQQHQAVLAYQDHFERSAEDVVADLTRYAALLEKWQPVQNLVSRETLTSVWLRHFADSLQILSQLHSDDITFLDLGSGGGLPALPLAIALKSGPQRFTLVEPNSRKVSFLRTVARELGLAVTVEARRGEQIDSRETSCPDVITSRALAPLPQLCQWIEPFFGRRTRAILHKGREHVEEVRDAATQWDFDVLVTKSDSDPGGVLLTLTNLHAKTVR